MSEPPVGTMLRVGAPVGLGDHLMFVRVEEGPRGWVQHVNSSLHGGRVSWPVVRFWL